MDAQTDGRLDRLTETRGQSEDRRRSKENITDFNQRLNDEERSHFTKTVRKAVRDSRETLIESACVFGFARLRVCVCVNLCAFVRVYFAWACVWVRLCVRNYVLAFLVSF